MSWYHEGNEGAEALIASSGTFRKQRNFFTKEGEPAAKIRFLRPAQESFAYKRSFVKHAKGQKLFTSWDEPDCPIVRHPNQQLQIAFAWVVIDRRVLKFKDNNTGEEREVGPRVMYFADGIRTRKQLISFEKEMLANKNEERAEDGLDPLKLEDYNLTHYDVKVKKDKGAPWTITQVRPKELSKEDKELLEKEPIDLKEELAPLPKVELQQIIGGSAAETAQTESTTEYGYDESDDDTIDFAEEDKN